MCYERGAIAMRRTIFTGCPLGLVLGYRAPSLYKSKPWVEGEPPPSPYGALLGQWSSSHSHATVLSSNLAGMFIPSLSSFYETSVSCWIGEISLDTKRMELPFIENT